MSSRNVLATVLALGATVVACGAPTRPASVAVNATAACSDAPTCEQSCQADVLAACVRASTLMTRHPLAASFERLMAVQDRACTLGHGRSCAELAAHLLGAPVVTSDPTRARALRERACTLGDGIGCVSLIVDPESLAHRDKASAQDRATLDRAEAALRRNCDDHDGRGCVILSTLLMGKGDTEQALALMQRSSREFERSCLEGDADDCENGSLELALPGGEQDEKRTRRLLERGCDLGSTRACAQLAQGARSGRSAEDVRTLRRACDADSERSCLRLGMMISRNEVPLAEPAEAPVLLERGKALSRARCERAESDGCTMLATLLQGGMLKDDAGRSAVDLLAAVCERGSPETCARLGEALSSDSIPVAFLDPDRAERLKKRACEKGYSLACPDPMAALALYPRLDVPVIDRQARLAWEPVAKDPEPLDDARRACAPPQRLPTRADLATLVGPDGTLRRFARATLPARGHLLSSELADDGRPWALDVIDGHIVASDRGQGHRRCVSDLPARTPPARGVVRLAVYGSSITYGLRPTSGRAPTEVTLPIADVLAPAALVGLDARTGEVDVEVDAGSDFGPVTRFVQGATKSGVAVRSVVLVRSPPP